MRERKEDIELLTAAFIREFAKENSKPVEGIDQKARAALYGHDWPGNVRELRNTIESAVVMAKGNIITVEDLPPSITNESESQTVRIAIGSRLSDAEREIIRSTLAAQNGNKTRTAEMLGIGRKTLHRKIAEYGLE